MKANKTGTALPRSAVIRLPGFCSLVLNFAELSTYCVQVAAGNVCSAALFLPMQEWVREFYFSVILRALRSCGFSAMVGISA